MSRKETYEDRAWALLCRVCEELGMTPVDAEFAKEGRDYNLLCYIDREGGVGIDDCEAVSKALDPLLDEEDFIEEAYTLIVSSPGLGRPLKRPRDFLFAMGREVELGTYRAVDGKKDFRGILTDASDRTVTIETDGETKTFERAQLARIRLAFDF
ncbi:MAG: ribosome maturation factor RimP [Lachnospiraceae bacterium]|nr:ribosome maturation factor RimP [Lachnospiraceae bacterium]